MMRVQTEWHGGRPSCLPPMDALETHQITQASVMEYLAKHGAQQSRLIAIGMESDQRKVIAKINPLVITRLVIREKKRDPQIGQIVWFYRLREVLQ